MPKGICPKCRVKPVVNERSYCTECNREWQNAYNKTRPPQTFTRAQRDRQLELAKKRIASMTPDERQKYYGRKQAARLKWLKTKPEMLEAINLRARKKRASWTPERRERERANGKAHYARRILRSEKGLCAYSLNCNEPPLGAQKFCLYHWCNGLRQADIRLKAEYTTEQLAELWLAQKGRCAITGVSLLAGDTASLDHIIPIVRGGTGLITNVRFIHWSINTMKWDQTDTEFKEFILRVCPTLIEWAKNTV